MRVDRVISELVVFLLLASLLFGPAPCPLGPAAGAGPDGSIINGPYLQNASATAITVRWETDNLEAGTVRYGQDDSYSLQASEASPALIHEVQLTGLTPSTTYHYYVETGAARSDGSTFITSPLGPAPFTFAVYGDSRSGHVTHGRLLALMRSKDPAFVLHTGDLVNDGGNLEDWDALLAIVSEYCPDTPYWPCIGNHDLPVAHYHAYFSLPDYEKWYSFDHGNAHFVALDSNSDISNGSDQNEWLRGDLMASEADWTFVFLHYPLYSAGKHGSDLALRDVLDPIFVDYCVTAVFCGHDHCYEHADPGNGVQYFVTGGGGAPLYEAGEDWFTTKSESVNHFLLVEVAGNTVTVKAVRADDTVIETVRIVDEGRPGEPTTASGGWALLVAIVVFVIASIAVILKVIRDRSSD